MSSHGFTTETDVLAVRAGAFAGLSERAARIVGSLNDTLDTHGDCWGTDAAGQAFATSHVESAGAALTGMGLIQTGLRDIGTRLSDSAATYAESELTGRDTVRASGTELI